MSSTSLPVARNIVTLNIPENYTAILCPPPGVLPCPSSESCVDGASGGMVWWRRVGREPRVDDETRACIEGVGLPLDVDVVDGVEQRGGADLNRLLPSSSGGTRHV